MKKIIILLLTFTYTHAYAYMGDMQKQNGNLLVGGKTNICHQTEEFFDGEWYNLTPEQKQRSMNLKLTLFTRNSMNLGGVLLARKKEMQLPYYGGTSHEGAAIIVGIDFSRPHTFYIKVGELRAKIYTCSPSVDTDE